jgi:protocatechuate 3,4-dioxygenase beta subunit
MPTYSIGDFDRREILAMLATLAASVVVSAGFTAAETPLRRTPEQILGPFYPVKPLPATSDLTRLPGRSGRARAVLNVMGQVLNLSEIRSLHGRGLASERAGALHTPKRPEPGTAGSNFEGVRY